MSLYVIEVPGKESSATPRYYLTVLPPKDFLTRGARTEAIVGELTGGPEKVDQAYINVNPVFLRFLGWVMAKHAEKNPALLGEVTRQRNGYVYVVDSRARTGVRTPPEDIIGGYQIEEGKILRYHVSPNYRPVAAGGTLGLDDFFQEKLLEELRDLIKE